MLAVARRTSVTTSSYTWSADSLQEADDECRIFAAAKRKMLKLRADKERQLHKYVQQQTCTSSYLTKTKWHFRHKRGIL